MSLASIIARRLFILGRWVATRATVALVIVLAISGADTIIIT